ncbi:MAG: transcriptional repressor [Deltaproteobacteria bacterium]|nr:transcriptional repressor [Deltaproteobacteria bacterium]
MIKEGGRLTLERTALLQIICDMKGHFTPENLLDELARKGHKVSLTTVYRNLSLLVETGIIRRTEWQDTGRLQGAYYERIWGKKHHDHLVCSCCKKRIEFSYPAIDILQDAVAKEYGFTLERHFLELIGICSKCSNNGAAVK